MDSVDDTIIDNEIDENKAEVKNMETGDKTAVSLQSFAKEFEDIMINAQTQKIAGI